MFSLNFNAISTADVSIQSVTGGINNNNNHENSK